MDVKVKRMLTMNFQPAPGIDHGPELPLIEKQAIVDQIYRGLPLLDEMKYYDQPAPDGTVYYVTEGWHVLQAIKEFVNNGFPTWDDATRKRWKKLHGMH